MKNAGFWFLVLFAIMLVAGRAFAADPENVLQSILALSVAAITFAVGVAILGREE